MTGIYIHIPFCKQACIYCNFHFKAGRFNTLSITNAIVKEIELRKNEYNQQIETIYFGGGTPSILPLTELETILLNIKNYFKTDNVKEITLEANPDDINEESLTAWKKLGINRLSIGTQSFVDTHLRWMNRSHNAQAAEDAIAKSIVAGFIVNADIIFGIPESTIEQLHFNLEKMMHLSVHHLSCYGLTLEDNTPWKKLISLYKYLPPDEDAASEQMVYALNFLRNHNWEHYEISNYCRDEHYALHNTNYWKNKPYLGFGPSAHSYNLTHRKWNIADNNAYVKALENSILPFETESLSNIEQCNEYIMLGLRTKWGFNLDKLADFGLNSELLNNQLKNLKESLLIRQDGRQIIVSDSGIVFADSIASKLFF